MNEFKIEWPYGGRQVFLAGTFNHWNLSLMAQASSTLWVAYIPLNRSPRDRSYTDPDCEIVEQYKFLVDGSWCYDIMKESMNDGSGNWNNFFKRVTKDNKQDDSLEVPEKMKRIVYGDYGFDVLIGEWTAEDRICPGKSARLCFDDFMTNCIKKTNGGSGSGSSGSGSGSGSGSDGNGNGNGNGTGKGNGNVNGNDNDNDNGNGRGRVLPLHDEPSKHQTRPLTTTVLEEGSNITISSKPPLQKRESIEERIRYNSQPSLFNLATYSPAVPKPPKLGSIKREKFSSTATIFLTKSISAPDVKAIVICLSKAIYWNIVEHGKLASKSTSEIFSELNYPLGDRYDWGKQPTQEEILEFLVRVFSGQNLGAECGILTAVYIERLMKMTGIKFSGDNWRRILLGAMLVASKVAEDVGIWNVDYLYSFPNISIKDLNRLEKEYLLCLKFTVSITATVYARYYFELMALAERNEENFPLKPLDGETVRALETRSIGVQENVRFKRSLSLDSYSSRGRLTLEQFQNKFGKKWQE